MRVNSNPAAGVRAEWIDIARFFCIAMVVAMHSTLGVERLSGDGGFMLDAVSWSMPFRMPDFFFISGMLAASAISLRRREFIDVKIVHFVYFYVLWLFIALAMRAALKSDLSFSALPIQFLKAMVEPFGTLWFIYVLPVFFIVVRLAGERFVWPAIGVAAVLHLVASLYLTGSGAAMSVGMTGSTAIDSVALYLIYFLLGHALRRHVMRWAELAGAHRITALAGIALWVVMHSLALASGLARVPGVTLVMGLAGAMAIVTLASVLAGTLAGGVTSLFGRNSLAIYLAFGIPMVLAREALMRIDLSIDPGLCALAITIIALVTPLAFQAIARRTPAAFLFRRPNWARLVSPRRPPVQSADQTCAAGAKNPRALETIAMARSL